MHVMLISLELGSHSAMASVITRCTCIIRDEND